MPTVQQIAEIERLERGLRSMEDTHPKTAEGFMRKVDHMLLLISELAHVNERAGRSQDMEFYARLHSHLGSLGDDAAALAGKKGAA